MRPLPLSAYAAPAVDAKPYAEPRYAVVSRSFLQEADTSETEAIDWFVACYHLTPRVERLDADHALLDLGHCTEAEALSALSALRTLLNHLVQAEICVRAGIGPTSVVAQLAAQIASTTYPQGGLLLVSTSAAPAFLKPLPIERLLTLRASDAVNVEMLIRLQRSGIRTIGQLARFDELTLRRQFGVVGGRLAAIAQGRSLHPFTPTPRPRILRFRLRHADPVTANDMPRHLARLAAGMAQTLDEEDRAAGHMILVVRWASGARTDMSGSFRWRARDPRSLTHDLTRLIMPELQRRSGQQIDEVRCILSDLERPLPAQNLLWPFERTTRADRRSRLQTVADALAQRNKRPTLLRSRRVAEHAIFSEDSYALSPLSAAHASNDDVTSRLRKQSAPAQHALDQHDAPLRLHWW